MADIAITALPVATYADVNDVFCIVQGGITKQLTNSLLFNNVSLNNPTLINATLGTPSSGNLSNCTGSPVLITPALGAATATSIASTGNVLISATGKTGYTTGSGGVVTQATNKATAVTLNKTNGQITLNAAALAADTTVAFALNNSLIEANDVLVLNHISGGTLGSYLLNASSSAGLANIYVRNITAASLSEAIVISYVVIKAVIA
jgi:hypothetical protein